MIRADSNLMTGVLLRSRERCRDTCTEQRGHVAPEAEIQVTCLQAKENKGLSQPPAALGGTRPANTLIADVRPPEL